MEKSNQIEENISNTKRYSQICKYLILIEPKTYHQRLIDFLHSVERHFADFIFQSLFVKRTYLFKQYDRILL